MNADSPPVQAVADRYELEEFVGSGGLATVWRAKDNKGGPDVAVKIPNTEDQDETVDVNETFRNEIESLRRFEGGAQPTSLIRFIGGDVGDQPYIILEFVDGVELSDRLTHEDISPGIDTMEMFGLPVVRSLEFLHTNGVCYLDCKPENVLVRDRDDSPVLIDLNTAQPSDSADVMFYEDDYKAPEQTPAVDIDAPSGPRSDVYAAAKLLCFLLTGMTMKTSETPSGGIDITSYDVDLPGDLDSVLQKATNSVPSKRQRDAGELLGDIREQVGSSTETALITDNRTDTICPIRPEDVVGRVSENGPIPDIAVADPQQYVSPVHFQVNTDGGSWILSDNSLNGTWLRTETEWTRILSEEGYQRLRDQSKRGIPDSRPPTAAKVSTSTELRPVDPSYVIELELVI